MATLEDEPVRFFLEHQVQIDAWAQLAKDAQAAIASVLRDVRSDLARDERVISEGILLGERVAVENPTGPVLFRETWRDASEAPDVAVALGWDGPVDPARVWPGTSRPYTGVLTSHGTSRGRHIETLLRQHPDAAWGGGSRSPRPRVRRGSSWIVYRPIQSGPDWWRNPDAWRAGWVDRLLDDWALWAPRIEQSVAAQLPPSAET